MGNHYGDGKYEIIFVAFTKKENAEKKAVGSAKRRRSQPGKRFTNF